MLTLSMLRASSSVIDREAVSQAFGFTLDICIPFIQVICTLLTITVFQRDVSVRGCNFWLIVQTNS